MFNFLKNILKSSNIKFGDRYIFERKDVSPWSLTPKALELVVLDIKEGWVKYAFLLDDDSVLRTGSEWEVATISEFLSMYKKKN